MQTGDILVSANFSSPSINKDYDQILTLNVKDNLKILEVKIMYPTPIPENMLYLFENADYILTEEDYTLLEEKHNRAKNLKENNGAIYPGLTQSAVIWLATAYDAKKSINKQAFDNVIERLSNIQKPSRY